MATGVKRDEGQDVRGTLDQLEEGLERLRLAYEKYFAGIERMPPSRQRDQLDRLFRTLEGRATTNTVLRFRLGGLRARYVTYKHYWNRVEGQLERGTSRRDLLRRRRGLGKPQEPEAPPPEPEATPEAEIPAKGKGVKRRPARPDPAAAGIDPAHLRNVFKELVKAKRAAGESTQGLTYAALVRKLTKEAPKLKERHGCEQLQFSISTRGGKVRLRSGPK